MKRFPFTIIVLFLLVSPLKTFAAGPVQLVQGKCPEGDRISNTSFDKKLSSQATIFLSGLMANKQDVKTWQVLTIAPLKKNSNYYSPAVKTCKQRIADNSYLIDVLVTMQTGHLPYRMHLFATKDKKKWTIWGLTSY
ncbi:hypothetical protein ABFG93_07595 [Pseudalkalibacillus hwajinpoensis]|uniref:hypothetical protein n=1 Tax=Guptibacillus hwajinpoensis TaxID=208199 RepID=UPI00325ADEE4